MRYPDVEEEYRDRAEESAGGCRQELPAPAVAGAAEVLVELDEPVPFAEPPDLSGDPVDPLELLESPDAVLEDPEEPFESLDEPELLLDPVEALASRESVR